MVSVCIENIDAIIIKIFPFPWWEKERNQVTDSLYIFLVLPGFCYVILIKNKTMIV